MLEHGNRQMKPGRYQKLDLQLRDAFNDFLALELGKGKEGVTHVPRLRVPLAGPIDLVLAPKSGVTAVIVQRSDHLATYKHVVGQLVGTLAHLHRMGSVELRHGLERVQGYQGSEDLDVLEVAKRIGADLKGGRLTVAIATEKPELPQACEQLEESFLPVLKLLQTWLVTPVGKRRLCAAVKAYAVDLQSDPPQVGPLFGRAK